jgi:hypothetical protein
MPLHMIDAFTARYAGKDPGSAGAASPPDRRQRRRIPVRWPLTLWNYDGSARVETVTTNLSSSGFYCLSPMPLMPGEFVRCTLRVPTYDECRHIGLDCKALVVRAEAAADGFFGIACHIEEYHLADAND